MQKIKKYIQNKMRSLKEYLLDELSYTQIFEQALQRKKLREKIFNHMTQILQNWGLVLYGKLNNIQTTNHWKTELLTQCDSIIDSELKGGNKRGLIKDLVIDGDEFNNPDKVYRKLRRKFENDENISQKETKGIANYIADHIDELVDVLSSDSADEWVENTEM